MPLSLLDLPAVRAAVEDLYRILEHPDRTNETARRVLRWATGRTTSGERNPDTAGAGALIQAAIEQVLFHFGDHTRGPCPEITDSHLDLSTKATLIELRGELLPPFTAQTLATDAGVQVRFLVFLNDVLARMAHLAPSGSAAASPHPGGPTPMPTPESTAYDPYDREPRTFGELMVWMAHGAALNNPRFRTHRVLTRAHNPANHFLECYCREEFGTFDLSAVGRLRDRYLVKSGKTVAEVEETTLHEVAGHFGWRPRNPGGVQGVSGTGVLRKSADTAQAAGRSSRKPKLSTERGEGRAKLIAALTKHHQYADGGCLNHEPIGNNDLARLAAVSTSTASAFFTNEFKGHTRYKVLCRDAGGLVVALKLLNDGYSPHELYGRRPADEDDRADE